MQFEKKTENKYAKYDRYLLRIKWTGWKLESDLYRSMIYKCINFNPQWKNSENKIAKIVPAI